jgi:hypothetical protein
MSRIQPGTYSLDASHSNVEFAVKHMMITTVKGRFGDVTGTVVVPGSGEPVVDVTIGAASIDTRTDARDAHLRSADFFDVEAHQHIRLHAHRGPDDQGDHEAGDADRRGGGNRHRSLGQPKAGLQRRRKVQPQRFRPDLECSAGDWRRARERRSEDRDRRTVGRAGRSRGSVKDPFSVAAVTLKVENCRPPRERLPF